MLYRRVAKISVPPGVTRLNVLEHVTTTLEIADRQKGIELYIESVSAGIGEADSCTGQMKDLVRRVILIKDISININQSNGDVTVNNTSGNWADLRFETALRKTTVPAPMSVVESPWIRLGKRIGRLLGLRDSGKLR